MSTITTAAGCGPAPVDSLPRAPGGRYEDRSVVVARRTPIRLAGPERSITRTRHFALGRDDGRLVLVHDLSADDIHNGIGELLFDELFGPGWAAGADTFERLFAGLVLTSRAEPLDAWELFYRNTLQRLAENEKTTEAQPANVTVFSQIYRHCEHLISETGAASVLDVGTCFGFLALRLLAGSAGPVPTVTACDVSSRATQLLDEMAARLGHRFDTLACDAARIPLADSAVDVVTVLHLLEHVDEAHGIRIVSEAMRVARRRIVIAVPLEDRPEPTYGHIRQFDLNDLRSLADLHPGWSGAVDEFHGGWLVLDRISPVER